MEILIEGILDYCEMKEWKKRYFVMKYEVTSGIRYIEFYKDKNWRKQLPKHVVNLHPGYEVKRFKSDLKKKFRFTIKTTDHSLALASDDESIMNQWIETLEEYNLVKSFYVQPQDTPTMVKINAIYPCHLQLVHSEVRLVSAMDGQLLGMWPFKCIRRYKFDGNLFCIEAGRKAPTGQGMFEFISNECSEIYRVMDTIIRSKAGDSTMRRLASEKIQNNIEKQHLRKTKSVPPTPPKPVETGEFHYDYAAPSCNVPELPKSKPPSVDLPGLLKQSSPGERGLEADNSYDVLYPTRQSPQEDSFESQFSNSSEKTTQNNSYDTLRFDTSTTQGNNIQACNDLISAQASGGAYDSLQFNQHVLKSKTNDGKAMQLKTDRSGSYDKLQFSRTSKRNHSASSFEGDASGDNKPNDFESSDVDNVYNTLSHMQISQPSTPKDNTYDCLADSTNSCQPNANTYDTFARTLTSNVSIGNTSDHADKKPVLEKPVAPARPPPRKKAGNLHEETPDGNKKPVAPSRPVRIPKQRKAPLDSTDGKEALKPNTSKENLREIIQQKRSKSIDDDNDIYATVDHEYASIDYSKVSKSNSDHVSDVLYAEPSDPIDTRPTTSPPKPLKAKRSHPKVLKNIFKKNPPPPAKTPTPKAKTPTDGDVNFASELKKKLENKLKKSEGPSTRGSSGPSTAGQNADEGLYDEINNSTNTYSEPSINEMDV